MADGTITQVKLSNNKTYDISLPGLVVTPAQLNYVNGVTSNIQTQLNNKARLNHTHDTSHITSGTLSIARGGTGATDAAGAVSNLGGLSVVVSSTEPTNDNCAIWIKTS